MTDKSPRVEALEKGAVYGILTDAEKQELRIFLGLQSKRSVTTAVNMQRDEDGHVTLEETTRTA